MSSVGGKTLTCPGGEPRPKLVLAVRMCKALSLEAQTFQNKISWLSANSPGRLPGSREGWWDRGEKPLLKCTGIPDKNHSHLLKKKGARRRSSRHLPGVGGLHCPHCPTGTSSKPHRHLCSAVCGNWQHRAAPAQPLAG